MPSLFLQELLKLYYPLDKDRHFNMYDKVGKGLIPIQEEFTFEPLSSEEGNYIWKEKVNTDEVDVFDINTAKEYFDQTDNNNGGMIIEVTQRLDEDGSIACYNVCDTCKIAFVLGYEEEDYYEMVGSTYMECHIETEFSRLVSAREYMERTGSRSDTDLDVFITAFEGMLEYFEVEQVYDKRKAKSVKKKIDKFKNKIRETKEKAGV